MSEYEGQARPLLLSWMKDQDKTLDTLAKNPYGPVTQSFFTLHFRQFGIQGSWSLAEASKKKSVDLAILFYTLIGHRCFDADDLIKMRLAYENVEKLAKGKKDNSQKWLFAAYYYGARHEREMARKLAYAEKAIYDVNYSWAISDNLIETKLIRLFLWLRAYFPDNVVVEKARSRITLLVKNGLYNKSRWKELESESLEDSLARFRTECTPGTHQPGIGSP